MTFYLLRRLGASLVLFWLVLTVLFFVAHATPGDPSKLIEDSRMTEAERINLRRVYGLDRPLVEQYVLWLEAAVRGDWGTSLVQNRPVRRVLGDALPATLALAAMATAIQVSVGFLFGILGALHRDRPADHALRVLSLTFASMPVFWVGLMAILLFAVRWSIVPAGGLHSIGWESLPPLGQARDLIAHLILPASVLGLATSGSVARFVRISMIDALGQEHVRMARARGIPEWRVLGLHALRYALGPVVHVLALILPSLLAGSLITEVVFSLPGLGRIGLEAANARDYPVILASTAFAAVMVIAFNLVADLAHAAIDPRVREEQTGRAPA